MVALERGLAYLNAYPDNLGSLIYPALGHHDSVRSPKTQTTTRTLGRLARELPAIHEEVAQFRDTDRLLMAARAQRAREQAESALARDEYRRAGHVAKMIIRGAGQQDRVQKSETPRHLSS